MRYGICTGIENAGLVKKLGYDYIELSVTKTMGLDPAAYAAGKKALEESGTEAECFNILFPKTMNFVDGKTTSFDELEIYLEKAIVLNDEQVGKYGDILQPLPEKEFQNLNFESFKKDCADRRKQTADTFETNNYGFTATTSFDTDELVFFSVPYEKNAFTATVNGEPVNVEEVDCGLMAIPVPAGEADIVVTYHTPGLKASITISIAGIIIWILYAFVCYNKGKKKGTPELQEAKESTEVVE